MYVYVYIIHTYILMCVRVYMLIIKRERFWYPSFGFCYETINKTGFEIINLTENNKTSNNYYGIETKNRRP